ncbi:hypothetical protein QBC46DRAFT_386951 [Diplogelasinospora grovesii]|uniref:Uncharacterized protein n=1 Tax=Diplogelasinospora grovesii TaxID=303347 RepID=A0AAN6N7D5_9PEZI|nr:hypothetical protein QBC46DRAFT_386951 [Diplogelasinospora grovesii]
MADETDKISNGHVSNDEKDTTAENVDVEVDAEVEVEAKAEVSEVEDRAFSWLDPHPIFVIALVGPDETPFGIQKDFLCAKSSFYRQYFKENPNDGSIENLVRLPDTPVEVFAFAQNYMYTGQVFPNFDLLPTYDILISLWKLGHELGIDGLCDTTLDVMTECRRMTQHIPATPLLIQVWKDTPEGSSIRKLLLGWAAEYMRSSTERAEFAKSLPQEVLSELVVAMSSLPDIGTPQAVVPGPFPPGPQQPQSAMMPSSPQQQKRGPPLPYAEDTKMEIDMDAAASEAVMMADDNPRAAKRQRHSDVGLNANSNGSSRATPAKIIVRHKQTVRTSLPAGKPGGGGGGGGKGRRSNAAWAGDQGFSTNQKLDFCADLLNRMLSGPGFWTRLVGPFKQPVDPEKDGVPDYLTKVQKPMDLGTMKIKMDNKEYADEQEFLADMNQIFTNCYTYWNKKDPMWAHCEKLQKTFEEKYSQMNKWLSKLEGEEH